MGHQPPQAPFGQIRDRARKLLFVGDQFASGWGTLQRSRMDVSVVGALCRRSHIRNQRTLRKAHRRHT